MTTDREIQTLGAYVHGALTALHLLGIAYNVRRRNWFDTVMHAAWLVYDAHATRTHWNNRGN